MYVCCVGLNGDAVIVENLVLQSIEVYAHSMEESVAFDEEITSAGEHQYVPSTLSPQFCGGWIGWHCEGSFLMSLFSIMMWDIIFEVEVADVFQNRYQDAPLDFDFPNALFYLNR